MDKTWTIINTAVCISGEIIYNVRHVSSSLKLLYIKKTGDGESSFSLNIKTPVYSNRGTSHVLEHCIGNDILSDPITWNYIESSICNYNFYTLLDRTVFECRCKDKIISDFLLERTLYCVYQPSVYNRPNIFYIEACRKEINENNQVNGVVFNEMNQTLNRPDMLLNRVIPFSLGVSSYIAGGTPDEISKLSLEETLNYHRKYYRLSNSYLVVSANEELETYLEGIERIISKFNLSIIKEYVDFKPEDAGLGIGEKRMFWQGINVVKIPLCSLKNRYMFSVNFLLDKPDTIQKYLLYNSLNNIVFHKKLKAYDGMGKIILNTGIERPYIGFALALCQNEDIVTFYDDLMKILSNMDEQQSFYKSLNGAEWGIDVWERWLAEIFIYDMDLGKFIDSLNFNKEVLCQNTNFLQGKCSIALITPEKNIVSKGNKDIFAKNSLPPIKSENRVAEIHNTLCSDNKSFIEQAKRIWMGEKIELCYKNKDLRLYPNDKHDGFTYLYFYYDVNSLINSNSDISKLHFAVKAILKMAFETKEYGYIKNSGGIFNMHIIGCENNFNPDNVKVKLLLVGKILSGNEIKLLKFIKNIFTHKTNVENAIIDVLNTHYRALERQIYSEPDTLLRRRFKATCSMSGLIEEATLGIFMYETIGSEKKLVEYIGDKIEHFCDIFSLPAQLSVYSDSKIENEIMSFLSEPDHFPKPCDNLKNLALLDKREGFSIPLPNQYIAIGANYKRLGYADTGLVVLFSYLINVEYFRKRLRFETGAYSSFMRHYADGTLLFESINDPGLEVFIERIKELPAFLNSLVIREEDIDSLKREAVKKYLKDFVLNNSCDNKTIKYLKNVTWSYIEKQINTIMAATKKDFDCFVSQIECVINQNCLCVLGNERILKSKEDIFSIMGRLPIDLV